MTTFSISVPVGAYHDLLPACFTSLASQSEGLQVALLDASDDPRVAVLADRFAGLFSYRRHGPDAGQSAAIVEGWRNTGGDILGWLNADDFLFPGAIETARKAFGAGVDVIAGHSAICDEKGRMTGYHWAVEPPGENLRSGCVISQPSCFFRREAYDRAGGLDEALHYTMDWDLWLRLLQSGAKFGFVDQPLSVVYWGEGTKTLGMNAPRRRELLRLINAYAPPALRFRAMRGFALRALLDEMKPVSLSRAIEGRLRRRTPFVYGVGPRGALGEAATIRWFHYDDAPKSELVIELEGDIAGIACSAPGGEARHADFGILVRFFEQVKAGTEVTLMLTKPSGGAARLKACGWR